MLNIETELMTQIMQTTLSATPFAHITIGVLNSGTIDSTMVGSYNLQVNIPSDAASRVVSFNGSMSSMQIGVISAISGELIF